jgi:alpha-N-arabinofuranosidase
MDDNLISRRAFATALAAAPAFLAAQNASRVARIKIDTDRKIAPIDPKIYGNFAEHLGRCIEGGIFDEGSPLSDSHGYRKDVMQAVRDLHVTLLRWPGGNFSSNYDWMDGIGPRDQRPKRLEMAWGTIEDNRFGTHEALDYCELLGIQPYICTNLGTGTWTEAQRWVEYCNFEGGTAISDLRKKNGRERPWKVPYWGLGNEMDGPWQMGHRSAEDYGKFALEAAKLMHWTDPTIHLIAAGSSNFGPDADWSGWNRTVLAYLRDHIDYISLHTYVGNASEDSPEFLASSLEVNDRIRTTEGIIRAAQTGAHRRPIAIAFDEYNVWYRARGDGKMSGRRILEEHYNLEDALVIATFLNTFVNNAQIVKIANMAQLVNVIAPIFTDEKGLFLQTIYFPLQLFATHTHGTALEVSVDGPSYRTKRYDSVPYLDVSAALGDDGTVVFNVVNRHPDQEMEAEIEAEGQQLSALEIAVVNGPDLKTENDFGSQKVRTVTTTENLGSSKLRYRFAPHSYTMLKARLT